MSEPRWMQLLRHHIAQTSAAQTARKIGYTPAAISQVLSGKYKANTDHIAAAVLNTFDVCDCPAVQSTISLLQCRETALSQPPMHHPIKFRQWRTCQSCPNKPAQHKE